MKKLSFEMFNNIMTAFVMAGVIFMVAIGMAAWAGVPVVDYQETINTCSMAREVAASEINAPHNGMYFTSRGVADNICYGNQSEGYTYYLIYDDVDAGLKYEAIKVSQQTYAIVLDCLERGYEVCGTLVGSQEFETIVYELQIED